MIKKIHSLLFENTSAKQTIIKNTFWLILAEGINKGGIFLITILIARILGPEQFGMMSFVTSFVGMFIVLTDFGLTTLMVREVSKDQSKLCEYLINLSFLKIILGILTFLIVLIVSRWIGKSDPYITLILIYCGYAIINNIAEFLRAFFRPSEQMQYEAYMKIINGAIFIAVVGYMIITYGTLESIMYGFLVSAGVGIMVSGGYIIRIFSLREALIKKVDKQVLLLGVKSGVFLMGGMLAVSMFNYIDQVMIGYFRTEEELGYYSAAYKIVGGIITLCVLFISVLLPKISKLIEEKGDLDDFIRKLLIRVMPLTFAFLLVNYLLTGLIIKVILGNDYISIAITYIILSFSIIPILLNNIYGNILIISRKEKIYFISVIIGLVSNVILNIVFIPKFGINAAAITTIVTESLVFLMYFIAYQKSTLRPEL